MIRSTTYRIPALNVKGVLKTPICEVRLGKRAPRNTECSVAKRGSAPCGEAEQGHA